MNDLMDIPTEYIKVIYRNDRADVYFVCFVHSEHISKAILSDKDAERNDKLYNLVLFSDIVFDERKRTVLKSRYMLSDLIGLKVNIVDTITIYGTNRREFF